MSESPAAAAAGPVQQPAWNQPVGGIDVGLRVRNSLAVDQDKVPFVPTKGRTVSWYTCGPTVYDHSHIGHARNYVSFDIVRRIMTDYFGYQVFQVMNITDIDDKIIQRANQRQISFDTLSRQMEEEFLKDMKALGVRPPDALTRVSEYVPEIIKYIEKIVERGYAYEASGSVYFSVGQFREGGFPYARLQPWSVNDEQLLKEGEGALTNDLGKRHLMDFALWKKSKEGEPKWPSPWGEGRPGWHIECSAMASDILDFPLDIHSGGIDLKFPHHDNELAQSEAYFGKQQWVNYFLHAGHLHIQGLKMSKSLKNFITIKDCLTAYSPRQLRLLFIQHRYNDPMDYAESTMDAVVLKERRLNEFFLNTRAFLRSVPVAASQHWDGAAKAHHTKVRAAQQAMFEALSDDFNTPEALRILLDLVNATNAYRVGDAAPNSFVIRAAAAFVQQMMKIFGLAGDDELGFASTGAVSVEEAITPIINSLATVRDAVRSSARKNDAAAVAAALSAVPASVLSSTDSPVQPHVRALNDFIHTVKGYGENMPGVMQACDVVRDDILPKLGVRLEDRGADQDSIWKLDDPETIIREVERKREAAAAKSAQAAERAAEREAKEKAKKEKAKVSPVDMFKSQTDAYSQFDEQGVPTHDAAGKPLSKNAAKKVKKEWDDQKTLNDAYLAETAAAAAAQP